MSSDPLVTSRTKESTAQIGLAIALWWVVSSGALRSPCHRCPRLGGGAWVFKGCDGRVCDARSVQSPNCLLPSFGRYNFAVACSSLSSVLR